MTTPSDGPEPIGPDIDAILARIGPADTQRLNLPMREALLSATAADPTKLGSVLARHRQRAGLTPEQQAQLLGIDLDSLALLAVCRLPRQRHWDRDLQIVCNRSGAKRELLAALLLADRLSGQ